MRTPVQVAQEIREPIEIELTCQSKIKKWAFDNAYTLIFLSVLCVFNLIANIVIAILWG